MAAKATDKTTASETKGAAATETKAVSPTTTETKPVADKPKPEECVVDDGTPHMGRAVNGVVCSAHAMHYNAQGKKRGA